MHITVFCCVLFCGGSVPVQHPSGLLYTWTTIPLHHWGDPEEYMDKRVTLRTYHYKEQNKEKTKPHT